MDWYTRHPLHRTPVQGKCALLRNKLHTKSPGMDGYTYCSTTQVCTVQKQVLYYRQCIKQHPLQQTGVHYTPLHCSKPSALISKSFSANTLQHTLQRTAVQNISVHSTYFTELQCIGALALYLVLYTAIAGKSGNLGTRFLPFFLGQNLKKHSKPRKIL